MAQALRSVRSAAGGIAGKRRTMPPEGTNLVLASDVPYGERDVLVLNGLDVEAYNPSGPTSASSPSTHKRSQAGAMVVLVRAGTWCTAKR